MKKFKQYLTESEMLPARKIPLTNKKLYHVSTHNINAFDINEYIKHVKNDPLYDPGIYFVLDVSDLETYFEDYARKDIPLYLYTVKANNISLGVNIDWLHIWTNLVKEGEYPDNWDDYEEEGWMDSQFLNYDITGMNKPLLTRSYEYLIKNNIDGSFISSSETQGDGDFVCIWNTSKLKITSKKVVDTSKYENF